MKITCSNREQDNQPLLSIEAETTVEKTCLLRLYEEISEVQLEAIALGLAGTGNPCGSWRDSEGARDLQIALRLGGPTIRSERDVLAALREVAKLEDAAYRAAPAGTDLSEWGRIVEAIALSAYRGVAQWVAGEKGGRDNYEFQASKLSAIARYGAEIIAAYAAAPDAKESDR